MSDKMIRLRDENVFFFPLAVNKTWRLGTTHGHETVLLRVWCTACNDPLPETKWLLATAVLVFGGFLPSPKWQARADGSFL